MMIRFNYRVQVVIAMTIKLILLMNNYLIIKKVLMPNKSFKSFKQLYQEVVNSHYQHL